jgi:hypothetical protein
MHRDEPMMVWNGTDEALLGCPMNKCKRVYILGATVSHRRAQGWTMVFDGNDAKPGKRELHQNRVSAHSFDERHRFCVLGTAATIFARIWWSVYTLCSTNIQFQMHSKRRVRNVLFVHSKLKEWGLLAGIEDGR